MDALLAGHLAFWHWWVLGLLLLIAEILTTTTFCLWLAFATFATGLIVLVMPALGWELQFVLAAALSLAATATWFRFRRRAGNAPDNGLNQRSRGYVGRVLTLQSPIVNGVGQARLEDSVWRVTGPDLAGGARVRVMRADGATLHVEPLSEENPH